MYYYLLTITNHIIFTVVKLSPFVFAVKLEIDTTADERNQTNSNSLDMRPKGGARNADGTDHMRVDTEEIREELKYTLLETNAGHTLAPHAVAVVAAVAALLLVAIDWGWTSEQRAPRPTAVSQLTALTLLTFLFFFSWFILYYIY